MEPKTKNIPLSREQMEKLSTKRLLTYYKKRLRGIVLPEWEDSELFAPWIECKKICKEILAGREHVKNVG